MKCQEKNMKNINKSSSLNPTNPKRINLKPKIKKKIKTFKISLNNLNKVLNSSSFLEKYYKKIKNKKFQFSL